MIDEQEIAAVEAHVDNFQIAATDASLNEANAKLFNIGQYWQLARPVITKIVRRLLFFSKKLRAALDKFVAFMDELFPAATT